MIEITSLASLAFLVGLAAFSFGMRLFVFTAVTIGFFLLEEAAYGPTAFTGR